MAYADIREYIEADDEPFIRNNMWADRKSKNSSIISALGTNVVDLGWHIEHREKEVSEIAKDLIAVEATNASTKRANTVVDANGKVGFLTGVINLEFYVEPIIWFLLFAVSIFNIVFQVMEQSLPLTSVAVAFGALPLAIVTFRRAHTNARHHD